MRNAAKQRREELKRRFTTQKELERVVALADRAEALEKELAGYRSQDPLQAVAYYYDLGRIAADAEELNLPNENAASGPSE